MLIEFLTVAVGIAAILLLAEMVIRNAIELASYFNVSGSFIGLTVLAVGTSLPEIMSHIVGSVEILRHPQTMNAISGLLIGANIGSDIFQQNFILPVVALIGAVMVVRARLFDVMGGLLGAAILAWLFCLGGMINRLEGAMLVLAYCGYLVYLVKRDRRIEKISKNGSVNGHRALLSGIIITVAFTVMAVVTEEVVLASTALIAELPISASLFGVIFLGVATSLPELTTALISMAKGNRDISAGILLGSNVTNPLFGIGLGAMISTYRVPDVIVLYDLPVNIATAILLYIFLVRREDLSKLEAVILLACFFAYLYVRWALFPVDFPESG